MAQKRAFVARRVANPAISGWLPNHAVLVQDGVIADVVPATQLPEQPGDAWQVFDLGDASLLPGLIDTHAHMHCSATRDAYKLVTTESRERLVMRAAKNLRDALLSGVTTLRDLGSKNEVAFPIRDAVRAGVIPGPRLILAGTPITTTAGHCHMFGTEADSSHEVVVAVRRQKKLGADVIKMMATGGMFTPTANPRTPQYPAETLRAAVVEAERLDMQIVAHTLAAAGVRNCVDAGIHILIHSRWYSADPSAPLEYDVDTVKRMVDKGLWVDPTFGHHLLGQEARERGDAETPKHWSVAKAPVTDEDHVQAARDMHERGVRFVTGLDMGMNHASFSKSFASARAFVKWFGFSPWEAIRASTKDSAEALRLGSTVGAIAPGHVADLLAVGGDPAVEIAKLGDVRDVIQAGRPVKLDGASLI